MKDKTNPLASTMGFSQELTTIRTDEDVLYRQYKIARGGIQEWLIIFNQRHSTFLNLPAEIRNRIYTFTLGGHGLSFIGKRTLRGHDMCVQRTPVPAELRSFPTVSTQIHYEPAPLVFALN
ncbi:hypothetical protein E8E11_002056 [Didymella keratinophila]|nr:hypothetical protein E8E11_002056 [Didymella keratinophila]